MHECIGIILAGGQGTRLWPLSTPCCPKQFIARGHKQTLFESALTHALAITKYIYVSTQRAFEHLVQKNISPDFLIFEPAPKNTAAAIVLAAYVVSKKHPHATIFCMPSDHLISTTEQFQRTIHKGIDQAKSSDTIVLVGARPTTPSTQYGYIDCQNSQVISFIEKPSLERAQLLIQKSTMWWNTGIIIARVTTLLQCAAVQVPHILQAVQALVDDHDDRLFMNLTPQSFDYAVLEKQTMLSMVPAEFEWSDAGSLEEFIGAHYDKDTTNLVWSSKKVVLHHVDGLCVIATDDIILIAPRNEAHTIYKLRDELK